MTRRVSVLINNYNYERFVGQAILSALDQTHGNVEIICVDDGSTDNSREVISSFPGVIPLFKENGGQTSAMRAGLAAATGEIVVFLDADDVLLPNACERIATLWQDDCSYLQYKLKVFSSEEPDLGSMPEREFLATGHVEHLIQYGRFPYAPTSGNAFSRAAALEILELTRHPDREFADMILAMCAPFVGRVLHTSERLAGYRVHKSNHSWSVLPGESYFGAERVEREIREFAAAHGVDLPPDAMLTGAYHLQKGVKLYLNGDERISANHARATARRMIAAFARSPGIPLARRVKNIGLAAMVLASPPACRTLVGRLAKHAQNTPLHARQA